MTIRKRMTTTICLIIVIIMCLIGIISNFSYKSFIANASTIETFVGTSGSPSGEYLYNATNTYNYNGANNLPDVSAKSSYEYYDTDTGSKNSNLVYDGAPQITVLTHGLGGDASHWSNNGAGDFARDPRSLFSRLNEEFNKNEGVGASIYWAKMVSTDSFYLYDLNDSSNIDNITYEYLQNETKTSITDTTKHIIIVFEAYETDGYNYKVYEEFNYMLSKIVYDVKCLNGGALPKINLIGHSRGGLTNLQYALDHPDMVASMFSLGTPFFGSDSASTSLGAEFAPGNGRLDIINRNMFVGYHERWINDYDRLYSDINAHALGGYSDSDFVLDALIESNDPEIEGMVSDEWFQVAKWAIKILGGAVNSLNTTAELIDFAASFFRDIDYTQSELESIIQIIADIQYISVDGNNDFWGNLWDNIKHNIPIVGCPYFMNDLLVDLSSQLGYDEHSDIYRSYGLKTFSKCFKSSDYSEDNPAKLSMPNMPAIVHNLEARDDDFINYILSNISLGNNDSRFLYDKTSDTTATVYGYSGEILTDTIEIPDHIDGLTINAVAGNLFVNKGNIVSIILPTTLKIIGDYAFAGLENLTTISFAESGTSQLEKIGYGAFAGCGNLTKFNSTNNGTLNMPTSVEFIDCYAFYGTGFTTVNLGANIDYIGDVAFSNIAGLTNISVSGNSQYFGSGGVLFNSDGWLMQYPVGKSNTSYEIPSSVSNVDIRHISQFAFMGENNLATINLSNVISIDSYAFMGCTSLATFNNASNVEYVGPFALDDTLIMQGTQDFVTLGKVLYKYNGTASVLNASNFPTGVTRISSNAFCCNDYIEKIYLPNNITDIDNNAFIDCTNLEEIIYYNTTLPDVGVYSFVALPNTFKFSCRKGAIDDLTSSSNWYSQQDILSAISTEVYFEDIDEYTTFYYGETIELPTEEIAGKFNKGWLRVNESTNQTYGNYLTPSAWNETVSTATYRADTLTLENYTMYFYNGETQIGSLNISTGDEFSITKTGYTLNGESYTFANSAAMTNCAYNEYYGPSVVNGQTIAIFEGWLLNGEPIDEGQWFYSYSDNDLYIYADWEPIWFTATVYDGYSTTSTVQFNYCDGLSLVEPTRSGYMFKGWKNNATGAIVSMPLRITSNVSLTAQWVQVYTITYANLTFMGQTADVLWDNYLYQDAPTYYERGVGLDLTRASAFWQSDSPYSPQLRFLGWYTDMSFTTKVTSISASATGNKTYYAKWRYDQDNPSRSGQYTIDNSDPMNQTYSDQRYLGLNRICETGRTLKEELKSIGITSLSFNLKLRHWGEGTASIFVYSENGNSLWSDSFIPGASSTNPGYYTKLVTLNLDILGECSYIYIRYQASSYKHLLFWTRSHYWYNDLIYMEMSYVVAGNDINDVNNEFYWHYQDPFD